MAAGQTRHAIELPGLLSLLAYHDINAQVQGLNDFPRDDWPPVPVVHISFQIMVGLGMLMLGVGAWYAVAAWRQGGVPVGKWLLRSIILAAPAGMLAVEAGWIVTEVGRQPWIIHGIMRTSEAVTPVPGLEVPFATFLVVYLGLAAVVVRILVNQVRAARAEPTRLPGSAPETPDAR